MHWNTPSPLDTIQFEPSRIFAAGLAQHQISNTAYPIGHLTTMRSYKVPRSQVQQFASQAWTEIDRLGLYVHVPFCEARCGFCEYTVIDPQTNAENEALYFDLLLREFERYRQALETDTKTLIGFDIGGGTPSAPDERQIGRVVEAARLRKLPPIRPIRSRLIMRWASGESAWACRRSTHVCWRRWGAALLHWIGTGERWSISVRQVSTASMWM
jgi:hypothetical protein